MELMYDLGVRRLLAIIIALLTMLPAVSPLFALGGGADPNLPACCRRDGKHHCMLMDMDGAGVSAANAGLTRDSFTAAVVSERCPYGAKIVPGTGRADWAIDTSAAVYAGLVAHPAGSVQTESKRRISEDRSRQKRGPPAALFF